MRWLILAAAALLAIPTVAGHAVYLASDPAKGARLTEAPGEVWVLLTEPVDPSTFNFMVLAADGAEVSVGDAILVAEPNARMSVPLPPGLGEGAYLARWQVLSTADGHITTGSFGFAIGDAEPPAADDDERTQASLLSPWARFGAFLGMALAAGAILFAVIGRPVPWTQPGLDRFLVAGTALNAAGVAALLADTVRQSGLPARTVIATDVGAVLAVRLAASLLALAAALAARKALPSRWLAAAAAGLVVAGLMSARLGHASLAGASAIFVDWMHLAAVETWLGGILLYLAVLLRAWRRDGPEAEVRQLGTRFGTVALACVIVIVLTGTVTTWTITRDYIPDARLLASAWGRFLAIKVGLMGIMLAAAAVNRRMIRAGSVGRRAQRLRRTVQVEAVFGVGALFLAALLTSISPPATATAPASGEDGLEPFEVHGESYMMLAQWDRQPASGASTVLSFRLTTHHGDAVENNTCGRSSCILLQLRPDSSEELQVYGVEPEGAGRWRTQPVLWVAPGQYNATIQVQTADVYLDELSFNVTVA